MRGYSDTQIRTHACLMYTCMLSTHACLSQTHPLWSNRSGNKVVLVHGPHPLTNGGAGAGDLGYGCRQEILAVDVRLDLGDHRFRDVVTVILEEAFQKFGRIMEHGFADIPVVVPLLSWSLSGHFLGLDLFHDTHSFDHNLHAQRRVLEGTDLDM